MDVDGGAPRRLTSGPGDSRGWAWSRDGRFVYVSSNRDGQTDIWRVPEAGGEAERITRTGATIAEETLDGSTLLYVASGNESPLMAMPLPHGPERRLADCVQLWGFEVTRVGVYYAACALDRAEAPLHVLDLTSGRDRVVGMLPTSRLRPFQGLTVSQDGSKVAFGKWVSDGTDLMMIDNFR